MFGKALLAVLASLMTLGTFTGTALMPVDAPASQQVA